MRSIIFSFILIAVFLCGTVCVVRPVLGKEKEAERISFDLDNVSVVIVAKLFSDLTGENFVVSDKARGAKITAIMPEKTPLSESLKTFETILDANGLAMVRKGKMIQIVPAK